MRYEENKLSSPNPYTVDSLLTVAHRDWWINVIRLSVNQHSQPTGKNFAGWLRMPLACGMVNRESTILTNI